MSSLSDFFKTHFLPILLAFFFFFLYGLISFVNHYNFHTAALDLGMYNNAVYDYAHFRFSYSESIQSEPVNLLSADHFDLFLILISPVYWLFGTYTLLVVQAIVIALGGLGIYRLVYSASEDRVLSILLACVFWSFYGVFSAFSYDYHGNVIAAGLLPWFVYYLLKNKHRKALVLFILIIFCKESMSLWMFFVCTGYAWVLRRDKAKRTYLLTLSLVSLAYFVALIKTVMPALGDMHLYAHTEYTAFGNSFGEIFLNILTQPDKALRYLFIEHCPDAAVKWTKIEFHIFILLSGGILFFFKPIYLWMMVPVYITKMYHDRWGVHGTGGQYSIEFAPVLVLCAWSVIQQMGRKRIAATVLLAFSLVVTIRSFDNTISYSDKTNLRFYQKRHYQAEFDRSAVKEAFRLIPDDAIISVQTQFHPHLASRDKAFQFPMGIDVAEYILFSNKRGFYPLTKDELDSILGSYKQNKKLSYIYSRDEIHLFTKKQ